MASPLPAHAQQIGVRDQLALAGAQCLALGPDRLLAFELRCGACVFLRVDAGRLGFGLPGDRPPASQPRVLRGPRLARQTGSRPSVHRAVAWQPRGLPAVAPSSAAAIPAGSRAQGALLPARSGAGRGWPRPCRCAPCATGCAWYHSCPSRASTVHQWGSISGHHPAKPTIGLRVALPSAVMSCGRHAAASGTRGATPVPNTQPNCAAVGAK